MKGTGVPDFSGQAGLGLEWPFFHRVCWGRESQTSGRAGRTQKHREKQMSEWVLRKHACGCHSFRSQFQQLSRLLYFQHWVLWGVTVSFMYISIFSYTRLITFLPFDLKKKKDTQVTFKFLYHSLRGNCFKKSEVKKTTGRGKSGKSKKKDRMKGETLWKQVQLHSRETQYLPHGYLSTRSAQHEVMRRWGEQSSGPQGAQSWREARNAQLHSGSWGLAKAPGHRAPQTALSRIGHTAGQHRTSFERHAWKGWADKANFCRLSNGAKAATPASAP